jgi:hypothetical protein
MELKLQYGFSRESHFSKQLESMGRFHIQNSEEIKGVTGMNLPGVSTASSQSEATGQTIHQTPQRPEEIGGIPPRTASNGYNRLPNFLRGSI